MTTRDSAPRSLKHKEEWAFVLIALVGALLCGYGQNVGLRPVGCLLLGACVGFTIARRSTWQCSPPHSEISLRLKTIYAQQPLPKAIFLAGPSPRKPKSGEAPVPSWRPGARAILEQLHFDGLVLVPELESLEAPDDYDAQIPWEWEGLNLCTVAVFWVNRDLAKLPGFTTNLELGLLVASGKVVLGYPEGTPKTKYLDRLAKRYHLHVYPTLEDTLREAVRRTRLPFGEYDA
jgi:hypothetical protein